MMGQRKIDFTAIYHPLLFILSAFLEKDILSLKDGITKENNVCPSALFIIKSPIVIISILHQKHSTVYQTL